MNPVFRNYFRLLFNCQSHARNDTPRLYLNLDFICLMLTQSYKERLTCRHLACLGLLSEGAVVCGPGWEVKISTGDLAIGGIEDAKRPHFLK